MKQKLHWDLAVLMKWNLRLGPSSYDEMKPSIGLNPGLDCGHRLTNQVVAMLKWNLRLVYPNSATDSDLPLY